MTATVSKLAEPRAGLVLPNWHLVTAQEDAMIAYFIEHYGSDPVYTERSVRYLADRMVQRLLIRDPAFSAYFSAEDEGTRFQWAQRIVDQVPAMVVAMGSDPDGGPYAPPQVVDIGWRLWWLYPETQAFEMARFGLRVLHMPADVPGWEDDGKDQAANVARVVQAIERQGFEVDYELWAKPRSDWVGCGTSKNFKPRELATLSS